MKVSIKTLQNTTFPIEIEPTDTILAIKTKIMQVEPKATSTDKQKLIHSGKILNNEKTAEESGIKDGDFIVLMISSAITATKPKSQAVNQTIDRPTSQPGNQAVSQSTTSQPINIDQSTTNQPSTTQPSTEQIPNTIQTPQIDTTDNILIGSAYEDAVKGIVEMGFEREQVIRAMKASFNNPDRAVEYLTNGFPITETDPEQTIPPSMDSNPLAFLRQLPQFRSLKAAVQNNPRLLGPLLEEIATSNPNIFELINDNQEFFMALLQEPFTDKDLTALQADLDADHDHDHDDGQQATQDELSEAANLIQVTEDEKAAIDRLVSLGFDRARAIEAYFACDKNENIAANFLFEHMNDEDF